MPVNLRAAGVYNFTLAPRDPLPLVRGWNRLEGRPRSEDFERSLKAEVRDPLWFLTRQWQFGEFEGDDAGSPIDAGRRLLFDAAQLVAAVRDGSHATRIGGFPNLTTAESQLLVDAGRALVDWYEHAYAQPAAEPRAWRSERLDYRFGVATQDGTR